MYRRDLILNETQKFAQLLAKLLGLKVDCQDDEATAFYHTVLTEEFGLNNAELQQLSNDDFKAFLSQKNFRIDQLDALAKLLYYNVQLPLNAETTVSLQKALVIFDVLEKEHRTQSFENIKIIHNINQLIKEYHA